MKENKINYIVIKEVLDGLRDNEKDLELASLLSKRYITIRDVLTKSGLPLDAACKMSGSYLLALLFKATHDPPKE